MRETTVIIWCLLLFVFGAALLFFAKRKKRKLDKYAGIYKLILALLTFLVSILAYWLAADTPHVIWVSRATVLLLGGINVYALYRRPWTVRHPTDFKQDAFLTEFLFVTVSGLLTATVFVAAPQSVGIIEYSKDVSAGIPDAPLIFLLPFLLFKLHDFAGQMPFRTVENPWIFPLEPVNAEEWPRRDLMQVNFEVRRSLTDEYDLRARPARPWIEAPKEVTVGMIFRLAMQERRKRADLGSIQDMGDEYDGTPQFCWLFSVKRIWYNPMTWHRNPRFINPDLSIKQNKIQKRDIISARRIPGDGSKAAGLNYAADYGEDTDKTVIINR